MSDDIEKLVEQKIKAKETEAASNAFQTRIILAIIFAFIGGFLATKFGTNQNFFWFVGIAAFLGFAYELLALAGLILLVKCVA